MPYLDIRSSKKIDESTRNKLQLEIGKIMPTIPGKDVSNTLICFADNYTMYKNTEQTESIFVDIRLYKNSPEDAKAAFAKKLAALFEESLQVPPSNVNMNFVEMPAWSVNGDYF